MKEPGAASQAEEEEESSFYSITAIYHSFLAKQLLILLFSFSLPVSPAGWLGSSQLPRRRASRSNIRLLNCEGDRTAGYRDKKQLNHQMTFMNLPSQDGPIQQAYISFNIYSR